MIAGIERGNEFCVIRWVGRVGLKAKVLTYCGATGDAGAGVIQISDRAFTENVSIVSADGQRVLHPCSTCRTAIR